MNENELSYKIIGVTIEVIPSITRNNKMIGNEYKKKLFNAKILITDCFILREQRKTTLSLKKLKVKRPLRKNQCN